MKRGKQHPSSCRSVSTAGSQAAPVALVPSLGFSITYKPRITCGFAVVWTSLSTGTNITSHQQHKLSAASYVRWGSDRYARVRKGLPFKENESGEKDVVAKDLKSPLG
jgi:hypothetical protein